MDLIDEIESTIETREDIITVQKVAYSFRENTILNDISLNIPRGRLVAITGLSGSGKTTLIKIIAGLIEPDEGEVYIEGVDISKIHRLKLFEMRKHMAFIFQGGALLNNLTVFENITLPLRYHENLTQEEMEKRIISALDQLDLVGIKDELPGHLSLNQRKLVGVARALIMEPRIIFDDEPMGAVDAIVRERLAKKINNWRDDPNVTVVSVTHNMEYIKQYADYIAILHNKRIFAYGKRDEILKSRDPILQRIMAIIVDETEMLAESVLGLMTGTEEDES